MTRDTINELRRALGAGGVDFRTSDIVISLIDEILQREHGSFIAASRKLYDETEDVSDDRDVELAREGLEPFLNL